MGGFKDIPLMEDVELMHRIKKVGGKIFIFSERVFTSPRRWEKEGVICCTLRNWFLLTLYHLGISPTKLAKYYPPAEEAVSKIISLFVIPCIMVITSPSFAQEKEHSCRRILRASITGNPSISPKSSVTLSTALSRKTIMSS